MDYESRALKWYWLLLFVVYSGGVVYLLFKGNPYLYSHLELRTALSAGSLTQMKTIPEQPVAPESLGAPTFYERYSFERSATAHGGSTHQRIFEEYEKHVVETGLPGWSPRSIAVDSTGFYITDASEWLVAIGLDGQVRWKYRFLKSTSDRGLLPPLIDEANVYAVHPKGEVVALDKTSGEIRWLQPMKAEVAASPFFWKTHLIVPAKVEKGVELIRVTRANGKREEKSPKLDIKQGFHLSKTSVGSLVAVVDNKVTSIDPETWKVEWTQTLTDPIRPPAVVYEQGIFVATLGAKLIRLDGSRKGKIDWELDLEKPAASPPAYVPLAHRLAFVDTNGSLVTVDAKTGKSVWRYGIENRNRLTETWSARLRGTHIEEFKMDWLHKGWTIWSPCSQNRFCIYTPAKGQLISRVPLSGEPLTLPLVAEKRLVFFTQSKPGQYLISHAVEEGEVKRLRKEAQKADDSSN